MLLNVLEVDGSIEKVSCFAVGLLGRKKKDQIRSYASQGRADQFVV